MKRGRRRGHEKKRGEPIPIPKHRGDRSRSEEDSRSMDRPTTHCPSTTYCSLLPPTDYIHNSWTGEFDAIPRTAKSTTAPSKTRENINVNVRSSHGNRVSSRTLWFSRPWKRLARTWSAERRRGRRVVGFEEGKKGSPGRAHTRTHTHTRTHGWHMSAGANCRKRPRLVLQDGHVLRGEGDGGGGLGGPLGERDRRGGGKGLETIEAAPEAGRSFSTSLRMRLLLYPTSVSPPPWRS